MRKYEHAVEGIMITDANLRIINVNRAFSATTGYSFEEAVGHTPRLLHSGNHPPDFYARMWDAIMKNGTWQGEIWNKRKNGDIYPEWLSIGSVKDDQGNVMYYFGIFSDITDRKKSEEQLKFLAHYDMLTGLHNRYYFFIKLSQTLQDAKRNRERFAILFIDLDGFKPINDLYGHDTGDDALRMVADRIRQCADEESNAARLGGDEFTVLIPRIESQEEALELAEKIDGRLKEPLSINDLKLNVSSSIGISIYPDNGSDEEALMHNADKEMYKNKRKNKLT